MDGGGADMEMDVPKLNCFCRKYDLVFMETGRVDKNDVFWFIDFFNKKRYYTAIEIDEKIREMCTNSSLVKHT